MVDPLMKDFEIFKENFLETFFKLINERIPNVRILAARAISKYATVKEDKSNIKEVADFLSNGKI
jgi:hypothetical protein